MDLAERFRTALQAGGREQRGDPDLLPVRLACAVVAVLPVDGAGLGLHGPEGLRTPLAASDETAALVERLQFTVGRGPCLVAVESAAPVVGTEQLLAREWPTFHDLLIAHTPVRSMLGLPLAGRLRDLGCLSLYFTDPAGAATVSLTDAGRLAELVSGQLERAADWSAWTGTSGSELLDTPDARRRGRLWLAVGMLMLAAQVRAPDALALLRARAYATGRTADDLAEDLVERRIHAENLLGDGPGEHGPDDDQAR